MIGAFNSVYAALQGFFSRSFWFATFLPVALFAALHTLVAAYALGPMRLFGIPLSFDSDTVAGDLASAGAAIVVGLVVIGYALVPFLPLFRGLLDGSLLPVALHDLLRKRRLDRARTTLEELRESFDDLGALEEMDGDAHDDNGRLLTAYRRAVNLANSNFTAEVDDAEKSLTNLEIALLSCSGSLRKAAESAQDAVVRTLTKNNPLPNKVTDAEKELARRTNKVADDLEELLARAAREAVYRYNVLRTRHRVVEALDNPRATLIGDARLVTERYARDVYRVDFDFLWPRLLVAIKAQKADDPMLEAIETARSKVDFAVMSLVLAASIPAVWLPVILVRGGDPWLFFAVGAATPLVLRFFYGLVFEGQLAFGDVVRTAIDRHRFLVLKMLHQPEPLSRSEERRLWTRIAAAEKDARTTDLVYVPTTSGAS